MGELDGGALAVDADAADLVGAQDAVDDRGQGAALEADQRGGHVLRLHVVHEPAGHRAHLAPRAEEVEHEVHLVDAVTHGRAAALGLPAAAPGHGVIRGVAVPGGLAVRDEGSSEGLLGEQPPYVPCPRAEAVLEDDRRVRAALRALLRLHGRVVGEGRHGRLLAPHPGARPQRGHALLAVQGRRGADGHEVGPLLRQHPLQIGVGVRDAAVRAELPDGGGIDVNGRHDLGLALGGELLESGQMGTAADGAGADDGGPDAAAVERDPGRSGGGHGRDQHSCDVRPFSRAVQRRAGSVQHMRTASAFPSAATYAAAVRPVNHACPLRRPAAGRARPGREGGGEEAGREAGRAREGGEWRRDGPRSRTGGSSAVNGPHTGRAHRPHTGHAAAVPRLSPALHRPHIGRASAVERGRLSGSGRGVPETPVNEAAHETATLPLHSLEPTVAAARRRPSPIGTWTP